MKNTKKEDVQKTVLNKLAYPELQNIRGGVKPNEFGGDGEPIVPPFEK